MSPIWDFEHTATYKELLRIYKSGDIISVSSATRFPNEPSLHLPVITNLESTLNESVLLDRASPSLSDISFDLPCNISEVSSLSHAFNPVEFINTLSTVTSAALDNPPADIAFNLPPQITESVEPVYVPAPSIVPTQKVCNAEDPADLLKPFYVGKDGHVWSRVVAGDSHMLTDGTAMIGTKWAKVAHRDGTHLRVIE